MKELAENNGLFAKKLSNSIDGILASLNILRIVTNTSEFENWLKTYHNERMENFFEGYKFFIISTIKLLISLLELDLSLGLEEDFTFFRARFKGVRIEDVPNTSEKTVIIKSIWMLTKGLRKAKSWNEVKASIVDLDPLIRLFNELYKIAKPVVGINKDLALNIATKFYTFVYLNDTRKGVPLGFISPSTIRLGLSREYLRFVFEGYVFTLQYLWFKLLGKDGFEKNSLRDLHKLIRDTTDDFREADKRWLALDTFYDKIRGEIIKPVEDNLNISLGLEPLLIAEDINKSILEPFLRKKVLPEPRYFEKKSEEDIKRWLDYKLLWYDTEVLSSTSSIFSGVPAFVSILIGVSIRSKDKILVKVFKHPVGERKYNYSYGILIPAFSSTGIADYSGWLIFFNCATDYSGFGGSLYLEAKTYIEILEKAGSIKLEEIEIDKDVFQDYIKERSVSSVFDRVVVQTPFESKTIDISEIKRESEEFRENVKGLLFEMMVYEWIQEKGDYDEVRHGYIINGEEIDVFSRKDNKMYIFECKVAIHEDDKSKVLKQIKRKIKFIKDRYPGYSVIPILITYHPLSLMRKKFFEDNGIKVKDDFGREFKRSKAISKSRLNLIKQIFGDASFQAPSFFCVSEL